MPVLTAWPPYAWAATTKLEALREAIRNSNSEKESVENGLTLTK